MSNGWRQTQNNHKTRWWAAEKTDDGWTGSTAKHTVVNDNWQRRRRAKVKDDIKEKGTRKGTGKKSKDVTKKKKNEDPEFRVSLPLGIWWWHRCLHYGHHQQQQEQQQVIVTNITVKVITFVISSFKSWGATTRWYWTHEKHRFIIIIQQQEQQQQEQQPKTTVVGWRCQVHDNSCYCYYYRCWGD